MKKLTVVTATLLVVLGITWKIGWATTYTTTYANPSDAPIYGTMIDPSSYYFTDPDGTNIGAKEAGNALDGNRVYIWDYSPSTEFKMMKWDMGFATNFVRVYPNVEHGGDNNWDYLQWSLWGSNSGAEDSKAWTLLWDPISTTGDSVDTFIVTQWAGIEPTTVYRYGSNLVGPDAYGDAFTMDFNLPASYRCFGIRVSSLAYYTTDPWWPGDPEIDTIATVPEPTTMLLLGSGLLGLAGLRRKFKK